MTQNSKLINKKIAGIVLATLVLLGAGLLVLQDGTSASSASENQIKPSSVQSNEPYTITTDSYCGVPYDLYCPSNFSGSLVILAGGIKGYKNFLTDWGKHLAENGYAALAFTTPPQDLDHVSQYVQECSSNLNIMLSFAFDQSFPIPVNQSTVSLVGMSGGGATVLSFSDSRVKASVAVCPYLVNDFRVQAKAPTLIITGENDAIAPPATNGNIYYQRVSTDSKMLLQQAGVGHDISPAGWKYTYAWLDYCTQNNANAYSTLTNVKNDTAISNSFSSFP